MNVVRAEMIAAAFRGMKGIRVEVHGHGIRIEYMGRQASFVREASFWSFLLQRIRASDVSKVGEIEARLVA